MACLVPTEYTKLYGITFQEAVRLISYWFFRHIVRVQRRNFFQYSGEIKTCVLLFGYCKLMVTVSKKERLNKNLEKLMITINTQL